MPSGNTNIMKKYIHNYNELKEFFESSYHVKSDPESIEYFISHCEGKYGLEEVIITHQKESKKCCNFIVDLELVLETNNLKNESKYRGFINLVEFYKHDYEETITKLIDLLPYAG